MTTALQARVRGGTLDGNDSYVATSGNHELLTTQGLPPYTELSRLGYGWQVMNTSALAAVVVRPSTVAGLTVYNGSTDKNYVIDRIGAFNLVTTDAIHDWSLWFCLHPAGMTAPTADITAIKGYSGLTYAGAAIVDTGATVTDNGWFSARDGHVGNPGTVTPGTAISYDLEGRIIVPPTGGFSVNVVASLVGDTFTHMISWFEIPTSVLSRET